MDDLLTIPDIAAKLKMAPKTVYSYVEKGDIPASMIIRTRNYGIRMRPADLEKWVELNRCN